PVAVQGKPLDDGHPLLTSREGVPVLALWPLVQLAVPTPGAPEELFLLEGRGRRRAKLCALPLGFERPDHAPREGFRAPLCVPRPLWRAAGRLRAPGRRREGPLPSPQQLRSRRCRPLLRPRARGGSLCEPPPRPAAPGCRRSVRRRQELVRPGRRHPLAARGL